METTRHHHQADEAIIKCTAYYYVTITDVLMLWCCERSPGLKEDILCEAELFPGLQLAHHHISQRMVARVLSAQLYLLHVQHVQPLQPSLLDYEH